MSKKLVWQHKFHAQSANLGFRWLPTATAEALVAAGAAQYPKCGANKLKHLDHTPLAMAQAGSGQAAAPKLNRSGQPKDNGQQPAADEPNAPVGD